MQGNQLLARNDMCILHQELLVCDYFKPPLNCSCYTQKSHCVCRLHGNNPAVQTVFLLVARTTSEKMQKQFTIAVQFLFSVTQSKICHPNWPESNSSAPLAAIWFWRNPNLEIKWRLKVIILYSYLRSSILRCDRSVFVVSFKKCVSWLFISSWRSWPMSTTEYRQWR